MVEGFRGLGKVLFCFLQWYWSSSRECWLEWRFALNIRLDIKWWNVRLELTRNRTLQVNCGRMHFLRLLFHYSSLSLLSPALYFALYLFLFSPRFFPFFVSLSGCPDSCKREYTIVRMYMHIYILIRHT